MMTENRDQLSSAEPTSAAGSSSCPAGPEKSLIKPGGFRYYIFALIISAIMSGASIATYHFYFAPKIVTFDLSAFLTSQKNGLMSGQITEEQFKANMDRFEQRILNTADNEIVLMRDAVFKGAKVFELNSPPAKTKE